MHLNPEQARAVETIEGPLLIVAGAGSGKTRVITYRIAELLSRGVSESNILALTFTNKAAREMRDRVRGVQGGELKALTISTFHAFGASLLRDHIARLGFTSRFSIYDQVDKQSLLREVAREIGVDASPGAIYSLGQVFSLLKTGRAEWSEENAELKPVYAEYGHHLKAYNAVDFDDLIVMPTRILTEHGDILDAERDRFRYILVDEFQDTSLAQYRLLRLLGEKHRNVCVVGDDDQSIYSWRGASYENLASFERDFSERIVVMLEQNYRSTREILAAANGVIANNTRRKPKALWTGIDGDGSIQLAFPEDDVREARFISRMIQTESLQSGLRYDDFGILVRANSLMAVIEEGLVAENIPYTVSGGSSFFARKEIRDLIGYLRVFANPDDDVSLLRIINTPRRGIGRKALEELRSIATRQGCSIFSAANAAIHAADSPLAGRSAGHIDSFVNLINDFAERARKARIADAVEGLAEEVDYWGHLLQENPEREELAKYKYRNVRTFVDMIRSWERDPDTADASIYAFLQRIALVSREDSTEESTGGRVNLMTIHAAKGLEFSVVLLAGVEDHLIPHARSLEEADGNIEEERRLFYVAMTRSKRTLYMTACRRRRVMRQIIDSVPSRFLREIPEGLIVVHEEETPVAKDAAEDLFAHIKSRLG